MAASEALDRITGADHIFDVLYDRIVRLELLPGTKISESETAKAFGYSRQPVREAFTRLASLNLLLIRPQRATIVRPFSHDVISNARFVRAAVELEVVRTAALSRDASVDGALKENMRAQKAAVEAGDTALFHSLDYEFHNLLCQSAGRPVAFTIIASNKAQVDRLCMLSLTSKEAVAALYGDHELLLDALFRGDAAAADQVLRTHLERLTPTIEKIYTTHKSYFES